MTVTEQGCEQRLCNSCFEYRPLTEFRLRTKGSTERMTDCRFCHNRKERERIRPIRQKRRRRKLTSGLNALAVEQDFQRVALLLRELTGKFGSTREFVEQIHRYYENSAPGSFGRFKVLRLALHLWEQDAEQQRQSSDFSQMSDEELQESIQQYAHELIAAHPELAVTAAADLGWTVIPPAIQTD